MKRDLKGRHFQNVEEVRGKNDGGTEGYHFATVQKCLEHWKKRWDKCIDCQGEYFEGD